MIRQNKIPYPIPFPNNMGIVRYILALGVLYGHFQGLTEAHIARISPNVFVGGFFALSGFLIYGSYLKRNDLKAYLVSRMRRLLPAYWGVVILFALLCFIFSTESPAHYFGSLQFWKYLASNLLFLNFLEPSLPGVFENLPEPVINGSLWTMKVEWMLYLSVPLVAWIIAKLRVSSVKVFIFIYVLSVGYKLLFLYLYERNGEEIYMILSRQFAGQMMFFYSGVLIYFYLDAFLKYRWYVLVFSVGLIMVGDHIPYYEVALMPLAVSCLVVWFSMVGRWGTFEGKRDNISYNIYLVHFPVINMVIASGVYARLGIVGGLAVSTAATVLVSWLINVLVEKPVRKIWRVR